uniref:Uncharacterized protein n=1 Tax=Timema cristinae TaxID=61476 RepID=A0A7R9GZV9_TIMCR|nr:unnamed protein product [Timema cristinae]
MSKPTHKLSSRFGTARSQQSEELSTSSVRPIIAEYDPKKRGVRTELADLVLTKGGQSVQRARAVFAARGERYNGNVVLVYFGGDGGPTHSQAVTALLKDF